MKKIPGALALLLTLALLSGCASFGAFGESLSRSWKGVNATMSTYDQNGNLIDRVRGNSFQVSRDTRFDKTNSSGETEEGDVLMISVGNSHISHVGSTMIMAQDGIVAVAGGNTTVDIVNTKQGTPWVNNFLEYNRNLWKGKAKTMMIRSQDGKPIAVFAGNEVEILDTDVPKSTWFRVDGQYLFVYRADYTVYDNALLTP